MPTILSVAEAVPPYEIKQEQVSEFARDLFSETFKDIGRLLAVFQNGEIDKRHFVKGLDWFKIDRSFEEKNDAYIEHGVELGLAAIKGCLHHYEFLSRPVPFAEIDAIFTVSSTGLATPGIEARIMNELPFSVHTKRIPLWGLGCAGGAAGLSRAYEYCLAYPEAKVIVLAIELCSLTFQRNDHSKSNLIGTSLFADGVACALIAGRNSNARHYQKRAAAPKIFATRSTTMPHSLEVMGWDVKNEGLFVVFSKNIPSLVENWLRPNVILFLQNFNLKIEDVDHFIAHPGGKKVLDAYVKSLSMPANMVEVSQDILRNFGNMSSATIFYVLKQFLQKGQSGQLGLAAALGPGFSSELLLMRWE
ncbi:type III polyketide synthase [Bacillus sp. V3-13]|uniref:type III polyketide synthase n=1 Tax=Bacillus sp. V3-13 TaxID=2053728 RepID=UPI000C78DF64|nr:3-oxoacyl-[acyl-carrier-protein] synthase III C-terminal domain-containing protein [Bacillus sp. V3-13]PLR77204.1 type III polyketide synthase [Bacillus sp. V3-13]